MKDRKRYKKILDAREKKNQGLLHASLEMQTSTHFPMLIKLTERSLGPIAELGGGLFSTPLLHWLCFDNGKEVITYESYKHYYDFVKLFETETHKIIFVKDWDTQEYLDHYGVVFIDHTIPGRTHTRADDALKFKDKADFIILHDAGQDSNPKYGYEKIYPEFKYRHDWTGCIPHVTVLSNKYDLSWLKN